MQRDRPRSARFWRAFAYLESMPTARIDADVTEGLKAVEAAANGDLIVEGYFATYELDRQNERFLARSFGQAIKAFLESGSRAFLYQHKPELGQLGIVEHLEERSKGLWGRARLPRPADSSPLLDHWQKIRDGYIKGVSIRTKMLARQLADGTRELIPKDIVEFSATPTPVSAGGVMAVATKALDDTTPDEPIGDDTAIIEYFNGQLTTLREAVKALEQRLPPKEDPAGD